MSDSGEYSGLSVDLGFRSRRFERLCLGFGTQEAPTDCNCLEAKLLSGCRPEGSENELGPTLDWALSLPLAPQLFPSDQVYCDTEKLKERERNDQW